MPRLHHMADANPFDFFDSVALKGSEVDHRALRSPSGIRLFGNANISLVEHTNMQVGNRLSSDQTSMIQNVYARTNISWFTLSPLHNAMLEWAHATVVTLVIGDKPQRQWPLSTLLDRRHGDRPVDAIDPDEAATYFDDLAAGMYEAYRRSGGTGRSWESLPDVAPLGHAGELGKRPWQKAAHWAHDHLKSPQLLIVPVRQCVSVVVQTNERVLGKLLEFIPPGISPMPLVWIHLEGFARRDVC